MSGSNILIYFVRRDLRVSDNPILHFLASAEHGFTHLLPIFVIPARQMVISGFVKDGNKSPYPEARSEVGGFFRCGPHRAKFIGEAVWNMKKNLKVLGSDLVLRVGMLGDITKQVLEALEAKKHKVGAVWMIREEGTEEGHDQRAVAAECGSRGVDFKSWQDEKYFVDE
jgi:deoxyribodipyrimidine photo-lyase